MTESAVELQLENAQKKLENVEKMLLDQIHLITGLNAEVKLLQSELEIMKMFLQEWGNKMEKGHVYRKLEKVLTEVVHKAEKTVDDCLRQAAADFGKSNPKRVDLAKRVRSLREKEVEPVFAQARTVFTSLTMSNASPTTAAEPLTVEDKKDLASRNLIGVGRRRDGLYLLEPIPEDPEYDIEDWGTPLGLSFRKTVSGTNGLNKMDKSAQAEQKIPLVREDNVVGLDEEADTVVKCLTEESEKLEVISITGMPGLGKTTLASKIYRDVRIQYKFPTRIWVSVSQDFNIKHVFLTILKNFTHKDISGLKEDQLAQEVRSFLGKVKFVLFMDDVWTPDAWELIEAVLPLKNKSGKVLITSRVENVARRANPIRESHKLSFLDINRSWELLQLEVWGNLNGCPADLKVLGKDIAKQCGGLPLTIMVIGRILAEKSSASGSNIRDEWKKVSSSMTSYLNYHGNKTTENVIQLSYNMLSRDLRDCFLYLGMFPQDLEIPAWKLTRLWIAEGFIQLRPGKSLEEAAQENLVDLISKNLVMADKTNANGEIKSCHVHNIIREFCKSQAAYDNLFQEVKMTQDRDFGPPISEIQGFRRLCIHSCVADFLRQKPKVPHVRSFLCFSKEEVVLQPEYISSIPDAFSLVRVLDMNPIKFSKFPAKITQLIHLSYIALSGDNFRVLPDAISKLWNLQTLKIDTLSPTFAVEVDIWKMTQLRHFKTKAAIVLLNKEGKGKRIVKGKGGENLQTLSRLSVECCTKEVFNRASNLKNLGIRGDLSKLSKATCLAKLDHLQKLKLVYDIFPVSVSQNGLRALPSPETFPPNLTTLTLSSTYLDWKHMANLGHLGSLEVLNLKEFAFMGKHWEAVDGGFLCLQVLHIARTDLEIWTASGDPFPKLKRLQLKNCERLEDFPFSVLEKSLEVLNIERVSLSAVMLARKMEKKMQERNKRYPGFKLIIASGDGR